MRIEDLPLADSSKDVFRQCITRWYEECVPKVYRLDPRPEDVEWILPRVRDVHEAIRTISTPGTRRVHLSTLSSILKALDADSDETARLLQQAVQESDDKGLNQLGPHMSERFLPLESMKARLEELRLELPKHLAEETTDKENVLKYVALACYTLQPPLRRDWGDVQVCTDVATPSAARGKLVVAGNEWHLDIIQDKVLRSKGTTTLPITHELKDALLHSLRLFPRKYVLCQVAKPERPLGTAQPFTALLWKVHGKRKVGVNCYRKAWACTLNGKPDREWHDLARMMRTSAEKLRGIYLALDAPAPQDKVIGKTSEGHDIVERVTPSEWGKEHLAEQKRFDVGRFEDFRHKANRAVLLRDLKLHKRRPQAETLAKYGITWTGEDYV